MLIYPVGTSAACVAAAKKLSCVTDHPCPEVTHLLLDIPSFQEDGRLRDGRSLEEILVSLPESVVIIGGNLHTVPKGYRCIDLLRDPIYLAENAAITAECALTTAMEKTKAAVRRVPVLVIGWGRIGKSLAKLLRAADADLTLLIRKENDRAVAQSLGYPVLDPDALPEALPRFRLILNTAPDCVITEEMSEACKNCVKIDLASLPGIGGKDVIRARGLPGKQAPESSGQLIAQSIQRILGV